MVNLFTEQIEIFYFHKLELDRIKDKYSGCKFFPEIL